MNELAGSALARLLGGFVVLVAAIRTMADAVIAEQRRRKQDNVNDRIKFAGGQPPTELEGELVPHHPVANPKEWPGMKPTPQTAGSG